MRLTTEEYQRVLGFFQKAAQSEPRQWSYWCDIGFCQGKLGHWQEAVAAFQRIIDNSEASASIFSMLGHAYIKLELYREAGIALEKAHVLAPDNLGILYKLAVVHFHLGEIEKALSPLRHIVHHKPGSLKAQFSLGLVYHRLGDQEAAERQIAIVTVLNPRFATRLAKIVHG